jgi:signal transduction histidine kinase
MKPGDLIQLIKDTIRLDQITADRKSIQIQSHCDPIPEALLFDHRKLKQVVDNLISNAIKFSPPDSVIKVKITGANGNIQILVKDQGPGIPEDEQENVFKTFGKTSVRPTAGETSTGLGLAICNRIIVAHGGTITINCPAEGGSEFLVSLNVGQLKQIAAKPDEPPEAAKDPAM